MKKRVLIDTRIIVLANSGVTMYVRNLIKYMEQLDDSFEMILLTHKSQQDEWKGRFKLLVTETLTDSKQELQELGRLITQVTPDIYHATWHIPPEGLKCSIVYSVYDNLFAMHQMDPSLTPIQPRHNRLKVSVERTDMFLSISDTTRTDFIQTYQIPEKRIRTVYLAGLEDEEGSHMQFSSEEVHRNPYIITTGGFAYYKNKENLFRAIKIYLERHQKLHLYVTGASKNIPEAIQSLIKRLSLEEYVSSIGFLTRENYIDFMIGSKGLIFPSLYEGFGIPLLEAARLKVPIACSDIKIFRETMKDTVCYFNPNDPSNIAQKIENIIEKPLHVEKKISEAYERQRYFSWKITAEETLKAYWDVLNMPKTSQKAIFEYSSEA